MKFSALCISLLLLGTPLTLLKADPLNWGEEVNGLRMRIYPDHSGDPPTSMPSFRVELLNSGESDFVLNLGLMLANGNKQYPTKIVLIVTDAADKSRQFSLIEPGGIAGRVDALVVPLPAGSSFSIPVRLGKYWAAASMEFDYKFKAGTYYIEAQLMGTDAGGFAIPAMPYWKGTIVSNRLRFDVPKQ
jgi:hypothetical protein